MLILAFVSIAYSWAIARPVQSELLAKQRFENQQNLLPAKIRRLTSVMPTKNGPEIFKVIRAHMGEPDRDVGSGRQIFEWDLPEGTLSCSSDGGAPTFHLKSGKTIWLLRTRTPVGESIVGSHEMTTQPNRGMTAWIGVLELRANGSYRFRDSGTNLEARAGQWKNYFMNNTFGKYSVTYSKGIDRNTLLESFSKKALIATVRFESGKRRKRTSYSIVFDPEIRQLRFDCPSSTPFRIDWMF